MKLVNRMCFICRNIYPKQEMIRIVKTKTGEIRVDFSGKSEGRGCYLCKSSKCLDQLKKQKILNRAFKCEFPNEAYNILCEELIDKN